MTNAQRALANHVVETFQALLDRDVKNAIGGHNFDALNSLVCDAIGENSDDIIEQLEDILKEIRAGVEKRPLEL